jgi:hypothetical protein
LVSLWVSPLGFQIDFLSLCVITWSSLCESASYQSCWIKHHLPWASFELPHHLFTDPSSKNSHMLRCPLCHWWPSDCSKVN